MSQRLDMLDQMIAKGSDDPFVHYARAMELRSLERLEDARAAFAEVAERFPTYVPTYLMAAQVCEQLAQEDDARSWAERGIEKAKAA
ncbi:MAG TPA: tetratricopeptide repeat protein, partial [Polyangiaceae bacterium LLY-WYZ-15_(1-7)]|nr:tetratricopeptide repeat protein [Polyangiaceae bacterium LLY-WYZ-15_(1-7)]